MQEKHQNAPTAFDEDMAPDAALPIEEFMVRKHHTAKRSLKDEDEVFSTSRVREKRRQYLSRTKNQRLGRDEDQKGTTNIVVDGKVRRVSSILLRDLCQCAACVDPSTKQKLFSTTEIPANITDASTTQGSKDVSIQWEDDIPGYDQEHTTQIPMDQIRSIINICDPTPPIYAYDPGPRVCWDSATYSQLVDMDYDAYMQDDSVLLQALKQLHTHGLMFLKNVPDSEDSVSTIGERIGPIKNTFYGYTWDVRSVPDAKNVAYTAQNLGFHMDLLYMEQPPHLQLLHCIRSSSEGGASLFSDVSSHLLFIRILELTSTLRCGQSYKAASDLLQSEGADIFRQLSMRPVNFFYNHPSSHLYHQRRTVFELRPLAIDSLDFQGEFNRFKEFYETGYVRNLGPKKENADTWAAISPKKPLDITEYLSAVNWSPPFQAPFSLARPATTPIKFLGHLNKGMSIWHAGAQKFSQLIHRPESIYERLMKPGECVIFDNRRVLHARKAFEVGDVGQERWLRGAYLDKDPYLSKMRVLHEATLNVPERFDSGIYTTKRVDLSDGQSEG
jgi:gamma-butyrobetaine dioxygenase